MTRIIIAVWAVKMWVKPFARCPQERPTLDLLKTGRDINKRFT